MSSLLSVPVRAVAVGVDVLDGGARVVVDGDIVECRDVELIRKGEFGNIHDISNKCALESCGPVMPTRSVKPNKYFPIFSPPWFPDKPRNANTSALSTHFVSTTSIQCPVTPMNASLVVSAVQPSEVTETFPGAT